MNINEIHENVAKWGTDPFIAASQDELITEWASTYAVPASEWDAKAAYKLAVKWLYAASLEVDALNRDYQPVVKSDRYIHVAEDKLVPVYWVIWGHAASVRLFLPTKKLLQLRVEESKYILRKPVEVPGLQKLVYRNPRKEGNPPTRPQ